MTYKYDAISGNYYLMNGGKIELTTKEVAICYSIDGDAESTLLKHGSPEKVNNYLDYMKGIHQDAFPDEIEGLQFFKGPIPVEVLNKIVNNEVSPAEVHKEYLMSFN